jgi:GNAT superfamily N-acetyltransferase
MDPITIRLATPNDLADLADMWYENKIIQQQSDTRIRVLSDACSKWIAEAQFWLSNQRCAIWLASQSDKLLGYTVVWLQDMPPGVQPNCVGCVTDMAVDPHTPSGGVGQHLLDAAGAWVREHGVENMITVVPHRQPVQQAFWRGQGAQAWMDVMWLKL